MGYKRKVKFRELVAAISDNNFYYEPPFYSGGDCDIVSGKFNVDEYNRDGRRVGSFHMTSSGSQVVNGKRAGVIYGTVEVFYRVRNPDIRQLNEAIRLGQVLEANKLPFNPSPTMEQVAKAIDRYSGRLKAVANLIRDKR